MSEVVILIGIGVVLTLCRVLILIANWPAKTVSADWTGVTEGPPYPRIYLDQRFVGE